MKRRILAGALLATVIVAGGRVAGAADAEQPGPGPFEGPWMEACGKMNHYAHLAHMSRVLELNETQLNRIREIMDAEHENSAPLMESLRQYRKELMDAAQASTFDEAAVRAVAARLSQAEVELIVSRVRTQQRINSILTPQQRTLAQKLGPPIGPGPGHPPPFPGA